MSNVAALGLSSILSFNKVYQTSADQPVLHILTRPTHEDKMTLFWKKRHIASFHTHWLWLQIWPQVLDYILHKPYPTITGLAKTTHKNSSSSNACSSIESSSPYILSGGICGTLSVNISYITQPSEYISALSVIISVIIQVICYCFTVSIQGSQCRQVLRRAKMLKQPCLKMTCD